MKIRIYSTVIFCLIGLVSYGQAPDWSVNENDFEYTMSFVAFANIDGTNLSSTNDMVGAFSNGELRGATNLIYVESSDRYYAYLTIFSNTDQELMDFKMYNSVSNEIIDVPKTINFEISAHYGDLFQAYSFASPTLSNAAEIVSFEFADAAINNQGASGNEITINLEQNISVMALNAVFQLSPGAKLLLNAADLVSGSNAIDFSEPVVFQVLSEDESEAKEWTITVNTSATATSLKYYKKDAVCYAGGVIKVESSTNDIEAQLTKDGTNFGSKIITNGEALFTGLDVGIYLLKVGSFEKQITISLKN